MTQPPRKRKSAPQAAPPSSDDVTLTLRTPKPPATTSAAPSEAQTIASPSAQSPGEAGWQPGDVVEKLYRIERMLAQGGMGVVHLATDLSNERPVVIKSLLAEFSRNEEYKLRFLREAREWVGLGAHPHIVRAYTALEIDYRPRIIAEYVGGGSLHDLLKTQPPPLRRALDIAAQICWGMTCAHDKNLAHRDLKPGNVLLTLDGIAKITDFGLVKQIEDDQAETKIIRHGAPAAGGALMTLGVIGTPEYIAPEQWDGRGGKEADIYAFGVMLYELFSHKRPFDFHELEGMTRITAYYETHTKQAPPRPQAPTADTDTLPEPLSQLMLQCLAKDPRKRPRDFKQIAETLNAVSQTLFGETAADAPTPAELDQQARHDQAQGLMRLARSCYAHGEYSEAHELLDRAEAAFRALADNSGAFEARHQRALLLYNTGQIDKALELAQQNLVQARAEQNPLRIGHSENLMGILCVVRGQMREAVAFFLAAIKHLPADNTRFVAACHNNLALTYRDLNELEPALRHIEHAVALREQIDDLTGLCISLNNLCTVCLPLGQLERAQQSAERSLAIARHIANPMVEAKSLHNLARVAQDRGDFAAALAHMQASCVLLEKLSAVDDLIDALCAKAVVLARLTRLDEAGDALQHAKQLRAQTPLRRISILMTEAELALAQGRAADALAPAQQANELAKQAWPAGRDEIDRLLERIEAGASRPRDLS